MFWIFESDFRYFQVFGSSSGILGPKYLNRPGSESEIYPEIMDILQGIIELNRSEFDKTPPGTDPKNYRYLYGSNMDLNF